MYICTHVNRDSSKKGSSVAQVTWGTLRCEFYLLNFSPVLGEIWWRSHAGPLYLAVLGPP